MVTSIKNYLEPFRNTSKLMLIGPLASTSITPVEPVIFIDGGSRLRNGKQGISVGDGDSSEVQLDVQINPHKDFSDLAYALSSIPEHFTEIYLYGFLGGRLDHQLFNFGEVYRFMNHRQSLTRLFFYNKAICYSAGQWEFTHYGQFSLACLDETIIQLSGKVDYVCETDTKFSVLSSLGLGNMANGSVNLSCNKSVFILFSEQ